MTEQAKLYDASDVSINIYRLIFNMLWIYTSENFSPYEYRCYGFYGSVKDKRDEFIPEESLKWTFKTDKTINMLPRNKFGRYKMFSSLFHRDIICLYSDRDDEMKKVFSEFQKKHSEAIFKPLKGAQGKGVIKLSIDGMDYSILRKKIGNGDYMIEEVIDQGAELSKFHPSSINTIRYVTAMSPEGNYSVLYSMLRCGGGGSVVDNVGSGGFIMLVDENGVVETDAMRAGEYYEKHPDTGVSFKGSNIPSWNELQAIAENAHRTVPNQRLFGWDFAWTKNGWDLVEVNPGPAVVSWQILKGKGLKPRFREVGIL